MVGGVILAGLLVAQGVSPCKLMQICATPGKAESEACARVTSTSPDDVLVTVNGSAITRADADEELQAVLGIRIKQMPERELEAVRAQWTPRVLDMLVTRTLLQQAADAEEVTVSDAAITEAIEEVSSRLPEGTSLDDLKEALGMSEEEWTAELTQNARIEKLLDSHAGSAGDPTDAEIETFYRDNPSLFDVPETVEARHILISVSLEDDEAKRAEKKTQADAIRDRLTTDTGESFEDVAGEVSDCPSAAQGGNLGVFARGQMVAAFEEAAFAQEPGVIGPVVETQFGYHIIKVEERIMPKTVLLDEARDTIAERLRAKKREEAFEAYVAQLRSNASIQHHGAEDAA
jgi:peptidyl-prolyl cis-trans isomerase C